MSQSEHPDWSVSTFEKQKVVVQSDEYMRAFVSNRAKELAEFGILDETRCRFDIPFDVQQEIARQLDQLHMSPRID